MYGPLPEHAVVGQKIFQEGKTYVEGGGKNDNKIYNNCKNFRGS